ncbi:MAG: baseplate J/gp47 family protein [Chloroflexia bacterium]|nr:baseplate J/gp47 family protein [Chloroflexia bacterium]
MTERKPSVVITSEDTLPGVVERLRSAAQGGQTVDLVVPIDSALLLTAREFRSLKEAIDEDRLPVLLRTSDPLRLQLAERLGIPARALPRARVMAAAVAVPPAPPARTPVPQPQPPDNGDWPGETSVTGPVPRADPDRSWPRLDQADALARDGEELAGPDQDQDAGSEPMLSNPPRRWLPVAVVLGVLVIGAFLALNLLVPQATVRIVPRSAPLIGSVMFDVTADGQPLDAGAVFALAPQERQVEVVWESAAPVTGVRLEPDGTASSAIELRNASAEPLTIDAGTAVATETGVAFTFVEAVTVPAADPASGAPGAATGRVQAEAPGAAGNVGTGELGGRLPNGVYYSNRMGPAGGGSDKEFPVVAQADLEALSAAAIGAAPTLAATAVAETEPGAALLPATVSVAAQRDEFDHEVGEDTESVSLQATMTIVVQTYDGAAASADYEQRLASSLADDAPAGFALEPEEIVFGEPVAMEETERGIRLEVTAEADANAVLDEAERSALAAALAGASPEQATAILAESTDIADFSIEYQPSWLAPQMPKNAARIQFEVAE